MVAQSGQVTLSSACRPELALIVTRTLCPQSRHDLKRFERHPAVLPTADVEAEEIVVRRKSANTNAELITPFRHVIEIGDPVSQFDRVVIRKEVTQWAEPDPLCPQERLSEQQIGGRTRLPGRGEVFSNPSLLETKRIEPLEIIKIPLLAITDAPLGWVRRHQ
jgi:hypothetical protein